jgi:hypothetical protein
MYEKRVESYALHIPRKRQLKSFLFHFKFKLKLIIFKSILDCYLTSRNFFREPLFQPSSSVPQQAPRTGLRPINPATVCPKTFKKSSSSLECKHTQESGGHKFCGISLLRWWEGLNCLRACLKRTVRLRVHFSWSQGSHEGSKCSPTGISTNISRRSRSESTSTKDSSGALHPLSVLSVYSKDRLPLYR